MTTGSVLQALVSGVLVPAVVCLGVLLVARAILPAGVSARYAAALGFACGVFVGYALSFPAGLVPTRHWHWLPYLGAAAALVTPVTLATGVSRLERWLQHLLLSALAAWLVVPTWPSLDPPRSVYVPIVAGCFFLLSALGDPLPQRVNPGRFATALCFCAAALAAMIAWFVSLSYAQLAGLAAAALVGICLVTWLRGSESEVRGVLPAFAVLIGGVAFVACIEPQRPLYGILILPAAPLGLWLCTWRSLRKVSGMRLAALQAAAVAIPVAAAIALVYVASSASSVALERHPVRVIAAGHIGEQAEWLLRW